MRKLFILVLTFLLVFSGCVAKKENKSYDYDKIIKEYLLALTDKNIDKLNSLSVNGVPHEKGYKDTLEATLKSAVLKESKIRKETPTEVIIDAKVEVTCYDTEESKPSGHWIKGTTLSQKGFLLKNINNEWKIAEWSVIPNN